MDITEAFRSEDITKTDFFDFVVTSEAETQFSKQMRSVNAFLSNGSDQDSKETNNNMLTTGDINPVTTTVTTEASNFDPSFWGDKETVRLESAILEDLNKYCWTDQDVSNGISITKNNSVGTDGHSYTLTVLNGIDQTATWYRPPLTIIKDEDGSLSNSQTMDHIQASGLDIDSILSIMPGQMNGFNNNFNEGTMSPNTDGLIKSEPYSYEDSGYADNKDELTNSLIIDTPLLEAHDGFNNNNNDWKINNNNNSNSSNGTPDSLLRSALQGKAFVRYNGLKIKSENNTELRRVLSTPPSKTETVFIKDDLDKTPTIVAGIDINGTVIFEEHLPQRHTDSDNPSSTHSMDDILLSQLDHPYSDDYDERLKRIANEVAESVNQYCQIDGTGEPIYTISPDQINILSNISSPISITTAPVVTSTKTTKKYKRSNSNKSNNQSTVQSATSTSNGVRKERSLHYCSICSKGFKDKYSVNVHIRTHTGEKPFACGLCGKSFRQKAHLAKHYQTHIAQKNAASAGNVPTAKTKTR